MNYETYTTYLIERFKAQGDNHAAEVFMATLRVYRQMMQNRMLPTPQEIANEYSNGKSHREILRWIAESGNGVLRFYESVKLMRNADVFATPENAAPSVLSTLKRCKEFSRVAPGLWQLTEQQSNQTLQSDVPSECA